MIITLNYFTNVAQKLFIMHLNFLKNSNVVILLAVLLALLTGYLDNPILYQVASMVSDIFVNLLQLVSVPIIFLSVVSTVSGMENIGDFKILGKKVVKYTLLTTVIASTISLFVFIMIDPVQTHLAAPSGMENTLNDQKGYLSYLVQVIPSNAIQPFVEHHVIGVLFLAILLSLAILALPNNNREILHNFFSSFYAAVMKVTGWVVRGMPLAIWGFISLFIKEMKLGLELESLALYLSCVLISNLVQGLVVLPLFVKSKGISPIRLARGMFPALSLAFFTKSSSATLPMAIRCSQENLGISKKVSNFAFPLCTTINMNACAAFILTTVLFVSMSNGMTYSYVEMGLWIFIATIAAVGNAGVPMGCYFLSSAFLAAMNVPLYMLGIILPFYALIDMVETAINVWSDSCVVATVDREITEEAGLVPVPNNA